MEVTSDEQTAALVVNTAKMLTDAAGDLKDVIQSHTTELKKLIRQKKAAARNANRKPTRSTSSSLSAPGLRFLYSTDIKQVLASCSRSVQTDTITRLPYF
jgi:ABC-type transport system involved in cytochrome bd biosynthesis fused ATPase/permease subunit